MANYTFRDVEPLVYFAVFNDGCSTPTISGRRIPWACVDELKTLDQKSVRQFVSNILGKRYTSTPVTHVDWWLSTMSDSAFPHVSPEGYNEENPFVHFAFVYWMAVTPHFVSKRLTPEQIERFMSLSVHDQKAYAAELCNFTYMLDKVKLLDWHVSSL